MATEPRKNRKTRLLVIDDSHALTKAMEESLKPHDCEVFAHHDYSEAFKRVQEVRPDILVLDVMLGNGAGYQISRRVRSHPEFFRTPILFISSLGEMREIEYAFAQGADAYLVKPFNLNDLLQRLELLRQLHKSIESTDTLTGLKRIERMEREVDFRLLRNEAFALAHVVLAELSAYKNRKGPEKADAAVVNTAHMFQVELKALGCFETVLAHLGVGHFLLLTKAEDCTRICRHLTDQFAKLLPEFYTPEELEQGYLVASKHEGTYTGYPLMKLHMCVADTEKHKFDCAREMIQRLRHMHTKRKEEDRERYFCYKQKLKW